MTARWGLGLCLMIIIAAPAQGQSRREMADEIARLSRQIEELRLTVQRPGSSALRSGNSSEPVPTQLLTDLTVRMQSMERQIAELTGRVEELQYENRQLSDRLERFQGDAEFRFQQLAGAVATSDDEPALNDGSQQRGPDTNARLASNAATEVGSALPDVEEPVLRGDTIQEQYGYAFGLLRRNDFAAAEQAFKAFLEQHPGEDLAGNAQYWLGETYYVRQQYADAARAFLIGYRDFPSGSKGPDSLLKLALSLASLEQTEQACAALAQMAVRFPDASAVITRRVTESQARFSCDG